jgi:hypothetical protein
MRAWIHADRPGEYAPDRRRTCALTKQRSSCFAAGAFLAIRNFVMTVQLLHPAKGPVEVETEELQALSNIHRTRDRIRAVDGLQLVSIHRRCQCAKKQTLVCSNGRGSEGESPCPGRCGDWPNLVLLPPRLPDALLDRGCREEHIVERPYINGTSPGGSSAVEHQRRLALKPFAPKEPAGRSAEVNGPGAASEGVLRPNVT